MAEETLQVLVVEDNPGDARLIESHLRSDRGQVFDPPDLTRADSLAEAFDALERDHYDLVLLDLGLPESSGLDTLDRMNDFLAGEDVRPVPVVVLTGLSDHDAALQAIEAGAQDYLVKGDIDGASLERAIRYALERHEQERKLKRQNERLERFASVVSHDLRNPLDASGSVVELLIAETGADDPDYEKYEHLQRLHDRMAEIIEDVLTLARQGQSVDETEPVSLAAVADGCWETVGTMNATLVVETEATIEADRSRLRQLLENLFRNSVEHGSTSSRPAADDSVEHVGGNVTISLGDTDDGFYVADDGPGIPPEERDGIFEMGYTTNAEGTGFGLNIVREIAEAHGWTITVGESEDGGVRFDVDGVTRR